jgi:hypothetical protein
VKELFSDAPSARHLKKELREAQPPMTSAN